MKHQCTICKQIQELIFRMLHVSAIKNRNVHMKKITFLFALLALAFNMVSAQTIFGWETATVSGDSTTETIGAITVTATNDNVGAGVGIPTNWGGWQGSSGNVVRFGSTTSVTFTFDQAVNMNSILPMEGSGSDVNYIIARVDGNGVSPVNVSLTGGGAPGLVPVDLNWTGVTSFTVTASATSNIAFDDLSVSAQTVFGWETATVSGDSTTETIGAITVTATNDNVGAGVGIPTNWGGWQGSSGNVVRFGSTTSVTFTFDQAVNMNSILPMEGSGSDVNYIIARVDGSGVSPVNVSLTGGGAPGLVPVDLNWTGVTSFTVTASATSNIAFDDLSVNASASLSTVQSNYEFQKVLVFPNPVENVLYVKNISGLKSLNLYNDLGQLVLKSRQDNIDVSNLSKGIYFLQIHTDAGMKTKRIIKK